MPSIKLAYNGETRRMTRTPEMESFNGLCAFIAGVFPEVAEKCGEVSFLYTDPEGDQITIRTDGELQEAFAVSAVPRLTILLPDPERPETRLSAICARVQAMLQEGKPINAHELLHHELPKAPSCAQLWKLLAQAECMLGDIPQAWVAFREGVHNGLSTMDAFEPAFAPLRSLANFNQEALTDDNSTPQLQLPEAVEREDPVVEHSHESPTHTQAFMNRFLETTHYVASKINGAPTEDCQQQEETAVKPIVEEAPEEAPTKGDEDIVIVEVDEAESAPSTPSTPSTVGSVEKVPSTMEAAEPTAEPEPVSAPEPAVPETKLVYPEQVAMLREMGVALDECVLDILLADNKGDLEKTLTTLLS